MTTISKYTELSVPTYALSYLVSGDDSGLELDDKRAIDAWYSQFEQEAQENQGHVIFSLDSDNEEYFTWYPEFGKACVCESATIMLIRIV